MSYWSKNQYYHTHTATIDGTSSVSISPGVNWKLKILHGTLTLSNDATVANRNPRIQLQDSQGNQLSAIIRTNTAITASETKTVALDNHLLTGDYTDIGILKSDHAIIPIPFKVIYHNDKLYIDVSLGKAGDVLTSRISYLKVPFNEIFPRSE